MITDGLGNDISKTRCFFCGQKSHWASNFPEYGKYVCEPCDLFAILSPSRWSLIRKYFRNETYFQYRCSWILRFVWWQFCRMFHWRRFVEARSMPFWRKCRQE